jgi:Family of unknown function (DUF6112)
MHKLKAIWWQALVSGTGLVMPLATRVSAASAAGGAGGVSISPNGTGLPGIHQGESMTGGLLEWALVAAFVGMIASAGYWAVGHHSQSPAVSGKGRTGVLVSAACFVLLGAIGFLGNFFYKIGTGLS